MNGRYALPPGAVMNVWGMGWQSAVVETGHLFASQNASRVRHLHMTTTSAAVSTVLVASPWGAGRSFGRRLGFGRHLRARPQQAVDAPLVGGSGSLMKRTRRWSKPDSNSRSHPACPCRVRGETRTDQRREGHAPASTVGCSGNSDRTRSGWREATRTPKPAAFRWRTMRRPRNPVPLNTVTVCTVMTQIPTAGELSWERAYQTRAGGVMQLRRGYYAAAIGTSGRLRRNPQCGSLSRL